jgi:hypothetical protein
MQVSVCSDVVLLVLPAIDQDLRSMQAAIVLIFQLLSSCKTIQSCQVVPYLCFVFGLCPRLLLF